MIVRMWLPIVLAAAIGFGSAGCAQPEQEETSSRQGRSSSRVELQSADAASSSADSMRAWDFERLDGSRLTVRVRTKWRSGYLLYRVLFSPVDAVGDYSLLGSAVALNFYDKDGFEVEPEGRLDPITLMEAMLPMASSPQDAPAEYLEATGRARMDRASYQAITELRLGKRLVKR